jgi:predicted  nucleic acid-binding Zn-ribbon protein
VTVGPAELLLRHARLDERGQATAAEIDRLEGRLASNPEADRIEAGLTQARATQGEVALRLRERDREREDHRSKMRARERELMSGRIRNPTELMQMSDEVDHMKARLADEENQELALMEDAERADAEVKQLERDLQASRSAAEAAAPELRARLEQARAELSETESEREEVWRQVPAPYQAAYRRVRVRPPVAEVSGGQCRACRVAVTSSQMQQLRRGDAIVTCDNCGRLLVVA